MVQVPGQEVTGDRCPHVGFDLVGLVSGERSPGSCRRYACLVCGPRKTKGYQQLAAGSHPERLVTLTLAPPDFQRARVQVNDFVRRIRAAGYRWWWYWVIEENPKGTGHHIHGLQHGDYVPQRFLQSAWGDRIVHITRIRVEVEAARYVLKGAERASSYLSKGAVGQYEGHLRRNGYRCAHWSRGYMRIDGTEPATAAAARLAWLGVPDEPFVRALPSESHGDVVARVDRGEASRAAFLSGDRDYFARTPDELAALRR